MTKWVLGVMLILLGNSTVIASGRDAVLIQEPITEHDRLAWDSGMCVVAYYDLCSGWLWLWSAGVAGDEDGVAFDLPDDCMKDADEVCVNVGFWWYWRNTYPGYGFTVSYSMYNVDNALCEVGAPIGQLSVQDPVERWNWYEGLGSTTCDKVLIAATWDMGTLPLLATDAAAKNSNAGCAPVPEEAHSFWYGGGFTAYCPPLPLEDQIGPCNILMDATFSCEATSTEPASWGAVKSMFR